MQMGQMNLLLVDMLNGWDPFAIGAGNYETEIADVIQAVYDFDDLDKIGKSIQSIYEFSFEELLPLEECRKIAGKLLEIKNNSSCSI